MAWLYHTRYKLLYNNYTILNHRFCSSLNFIYVGIANLTQNNIAHKGIHHNSRPKLLGFIDNLKDDFALQTLHGSVIKDGSVVDLDVGNYILSSYAKFKSFAGALKVFDEMLERDVRTWTIMVSGFARIGLVRAGVNCFSKMVWGGVRPNGFTLSSVLKCCSYGRFVSVGTTIHGWILRNGIASDVVLKNSMLDFYVKCNKVDYAQRLFDQTNDVDIVAWNIMIGAYIENGSHESSLDLFRKLPTKDVATWNTVLSDLLRNGSEETALQLLYEMVSL